MKSKYVLGISALYHNSAAALVCDGRIVEAAEEERFSMFENSTNYIYALKNP